jgi:phosphoenolpyruvate carboxykinase (GTP)
VPISAILFGGRRASVVPLVFQSRDWNHGVFLGSIMASETTAAAAGAVGNLRRDPFAMLPFCGYNMGDYFEHWLEIGRDAPDQSVLPKIFYVNWFRKDADGKWLWPGYGENSRVLEWIFNRVIGEGDALETPIGAVPAPGGIDIENIDVSKEDMEELLRVDTDGWRAEVPLIREYYAQFGDRLPPALSAQVDELEKRLG